MTVEVIDIAAPTVPGRKLYRADQAVVAGVAGGLAEHLRIDVRGVRAVFVVLSFAGGLGVVMYLAFWAVVPQASAAAPAAGQQRRTAVASSAGRNRLLPLLPY
jgi:phage shock protein PspC (stress-responsive transcriptional regulator)